MTPGASAANSVACLRMSSELVVAQHADLKRDFWPVRPFLKEGVAR
jgi:hypothetical protein